MLQTSALNLYLIDHSISEFNSEWLLSEKDCWNKVCHVWKWVTVENCQKGKIFETDKVEHWECVCVRMIWDGA